MREQYADASNLKARGNLHAKYGRRSWFDWLAAQFDVPEGARVLDLGCGPGAIWSQLDGTLPPHLSVVLADLSPGMVRHAVGQLQTAPWTCVDGHVADASQLPYADNVFDTVIAVHMLYHLPDPVRGVREVARRSAADRTGLRDDERDLQHA